ncbi:centromere-associated protein E [Dromiciops gliroides]|uniref:centromere-associated protein E n=1 Tax=Dromiciops gliroides TaxID=33562 RepID=UPI001CC438B8|nr:centromere-associated protein E [Dromiciops gliroides]
MAEEGAVTVCVRVRPLISREQDLGDATQLHWKTEDRLISQIDGTRSFSFDRVFHSNDTTEKVYEEIAVPIICSAIQGYNGTIFAYGQTASGKTYTMMGSADGLGVIPKAINDIFKKIKEIPEREFLLRVSYMEIYNETVTDLLCDTRKMKPLEIREDFNRNVYVADLTEEVVSTPELALQWIKKGERNRHYGKTKMNQRSSRSHTIFKMILESREKGDPSNCDGAVMVSHLNLVDLAGSERASQTGSEGVRLKEGCNINRSLFILGQVIKKLSDGQAGGFINYRDSKLTRILQNSLGGNAKTLIICTITPVSLDETLSTLQFASTAKYMKNTPHVNEVLDDEALLKRYRKEIIDLKKQLEEVSSETRVQAMEKDQLAQLLEEKDLLQKVQYDKIQNLTQMLVTSSSITLQQDLKAKKKRRVTWCPGKMNKMKDIGYLDDFDTMKTAVARPVKPIIPSIVETDDSICSEFDLFSNTLETISEAEWNPATKLNQIQEQDLLDSVQLCETIISEKETVQNELNSLRANFDNLVLDYEQLQRKKAEMELKLNEKLELDEFVTLEMQTLKEQEKELNLKSQLLKEKEEQIKELQKLLELQRIENMKMNLSSSVENGEKLYIEELKHLKQSLSDTETIALDAKKETAFLKSENQDLKEKMEELSSRCKQLEKENHLYQSQLEERKDSSKRRQADLERELQSAFNEITKLTSIIDGKYPKDLLLAVELEKKVKDLQKDLDKEIEENAALQKEIDLLSELKSLPTELETLRKEKLEKSEELDLIMAEKDKLLAEVAYKDNRLQELLGEIEKTKEELAAAQSNHKTTTQEYQDFKQYHGELEKNYFTMIEDIEKMKHQIITISEEAHQVVLDLDDLVNEPSIETLEQEKLLKVREELCKAQQKLEEQLSSGNSGLRTVEMERLLLTEKPHESLGGSPTTCEKDDLKQSQESLQREKNQLKDSQDSANLNTSTQEELSNASESLKCREIMNTSSISTRELNYSDVQGTQNETLHELQGKAIKPDEGQNLEAPRNLVPLTDYEKDNELLQQQISSLIQEKNQLQQILECVTAEKDQLKTDLEENIEMSIENQEELRNMGAALKKQQETVIKERKKTAEKEGELLRTQEILAETEEKLNEKIQELEEKEEQILNVRKEVIEVQEKVNEMEQLRNQLKSKTSTLETVEMENLELAQKLQVSLEETASITKEINELKKTQMALQLEKDQLEENIREVLTKGLETQEELKIAKIYLKEHQETINKLKEYITERAAQGLNDQEYVEKVNAELQGKIQELQGKQEQVFNIREEIAESQEKVNEMEHLKEQLKSKDSILQRIEIENLELAQKLQASLEETTSVSDERDELIKTLMAHQEESHQLKQNIRDLEAKGLETQEELKIAQMNLKEHQETIDKLKDCISEKTAQVSETQEALEKTNAELQRRKIQELEEKKEQVFNVREEVTESQEKVNEVEHLKEQLKSKDSTLERMEMENLELAQKLQASVEETTSVTEERDALSKAQEALHIERDQLKETIRDLVAKDLERQEELKIAQMNLKEHLETIDKLKDCVSEKTAQVLETQEALEKTNAELQKRIQELQEKKEQVFNVREEVTESQEKVNEVEHLKEQLKSKDSTLERMEMENLERDQLKETIRDLVAKDLETQEELKIAQMNLKEHQETIDKLKDCISEKTAQVSETQEALEKTNAELQRRIQELEEKKEQVFNVREEVTESQEKVNEVEHLKEQLKSKDSTLERMEMENLELAQKLQASVEETTSVTEERDALSKAQEALHIERDQLKETIRDLVAKDLERQEELKIAQMNLKEHQETIDKLKDCVSEKTAQVSETQEALEKTNAELQRRIHELQEKKEQVFNVKEEITESQEKVNEMEHLKEQLKSKDSILQRIEIENLELAQKLQASLEETTSVSDERDELIKTLIAHQEESHQLKQNIRDLEAKGLETQEELKIAQMNLKEHQETIDKLKDCISEKTAQVSETQEALEKTNAELQRRIQELEEKKEQVFNVREEVTESQEKVNEVEHLKEQLKSKDSTLERMEMENLELAQKLQASVEETTSVTEERDALSKAQEALHIERDQLKETIRDLVAKDLERQEELKIAQMNLKEHQETIDKLKDCVSEKTAQVSETQEALEKTNAELQEKIQELQAKQEQMFNVREEISEAQEKMKEMEQLKEQLKSKDSALERINLEKLELSQKLQASLEKKTSLTEERDELTKTQEALHIERDQLKETIRDLIVKDQETQEELKFAEMCLKEHQETIDKLKECISEKTAQVSKSQEALEKTNAELREKMQLMTDKLKEDLSEKEAQILCIQGNLEKTHNELQQKTLKLQETEEVLLSMRREVNETKLQRQSLGHLEEQLKNMNHTLSVAQREKLDLTQKLDSSLSKMNTVIKERDALKETEKSLQTEINQLKESLKKSRVADQEKPKELINIEANTEEEIKQHPIESLKEKYLKINELLRKYTLMKNRCGFLSRVSLDLKRAFESQNELQVKVQACLPQQTKAVGKLLGSNWICNNDLHSSSMCILKKLEGVLKRVLDIRGKHHNTVNKFEMDLIEQAERQHELFIKIQHLQQHSELGSQELSDYKKLSQKMDLHIEQILEDVSETQNDIHNMVAELQQLLNAKKEIILFLEMCLSTHLDVDSLKKIIQEENDRIVHVNNSYHNKIKAIINESSEFEDRSVAVCKAWELELRQMKDKNEEMLQAMKTAPLPMDDPDTLTVGENKKHDLKLRHTRQTTKEIQETSFHEDKENKHKQVEIDQIQKNLQVVKVLGNKHLQSQQPGVQSSQDIKAVSNKEIDDLKMKLVKLNMEKMNESKKFEKEIASKTAIIEHKEEIISQLKENLRRAQQCNDISISEPSDHAQASHTPLTCGGGSGIIQSTKALILKADRVRLEREICKLKQQNEYLTNHQSQLSSTNFHLVREVKKWKERALQKEAQELSQVHSPRSPKLTESTSQKRQCTSPLHGEQISQETLPKDSPKSWACDGRSKSLPVTSRNNYFDNSRLGLLPEIAFSSTSDPTKEAQTPREENAGSLLDQWQTSSRKDAPECKTQ